MKSIAGLLVLTGVCILGYIVIIGDPAGGEQPITSPLALVLLAVISSLYLWVVKHLESGIFIAAEIGLALVTVIAIGFTNAMEMTKLIGFLGAVLVVTKAADEFNARLNGKLISWMFNPPAPETAPPPSPTSH